MNVSSVLDFLRRNADLKGNEEAIKNALQQLDADSWGRGYEERIKQRRKQRILVVMRRDSFIKRFLDFLSDLTHGVKKKS